MFPHLGQRQRRARLVFGPGLHVRVEHRPLLPLGQPDEVHDVAVPIERVGRQARHETVGDPFGKEQFVQQDGVQTAVEGRLHRAGVFPQSGMALHSSG